MPTKRTAKTTPTRRKASSAARRTQAVRDTAARARANPFASPISGGGPNFLRLADGPNIIRILWNPDHESYPWAFVKAPTHGGLRSDGTPFMRTLDGDFLWANPELVEFLGDRATDEDREAYAAHGDPATVLNRAVQAADKSKVKALDDDRNVKRPRPEWRCWFNATVNGQRGILEGGNKLFRGIKAVQDENPEFCDPEQGFSIKIVGDKSAPPAQMYTDPIVPRNSKAEPVDVDGLPDLRKPVVGLYLPYREKVDFVLRSYKPYLDLTGLKAKDFGV